MNVHRNTAVCLALFLVILAGCRSSPPSDLPVPLRVRGLWVPGSEPVVYRGANITCAEETEISAGDVALWKAWGINLVRINFNKDDLMNYKSGTPTPDDVWVPYVRNRARLEAWLALFDANEIEVMVCLDYLWGDDHKGGTVWQNGGDNDYLEHRLKLTAAMAAWFKSDWPLVRFLELWNEPHPYNEIYRTRFLDAAVAEVRSVNSDITIVCMSPSDWGLIPGIAGWTGVSDPKVAYSVHVYAPQSYTHQGLYNYPVLKEGWPAFHKNYSDSPLVWCDRAAVAEYLSALTDLKNRTGRRVFVSEFGVVRWAKDNDRYLQDMISVFEEEGYDWLFHSISGWNGWNPSFGAADPQSTQVVGGMDSAAFGVMQDAWGKNK